MFFSPIRVLWNAKCTIGQLNQVSQCKISDASIAFTVQFPSASMTKNLPLPICLTLTLVSFPSKRYTRMPIWLRNRLVSFDSIADRYYYSRSHIIETACR